MRGMNYVPSKMLQYQINLKIIEIDLITEIVQIEFQPIVSKFYLVFFLLIFRFNAKHIKKFALFGRFF